MHAVRVARAPPPPPQGAATVSSVPVEAMRRAHKQVMQQARLEEKFANKPTAWLDWAQVQTARARAVRLYEHGEQEGDGATATADDEAARLQRLFDATLLTWLTTVPPDRVGVTRQLQLGVTLKPRAASAAGGSSSGGGGGGFELDLSRPGGHKTSAIFGPSVTPVPEAAVALLGAWIAAAGLTVASKPYVFVMRPRAAGKGGDHSASRPLAPPQWTKLVQAAFRRHAGVSLAPKDLRSSFLTFLLSDENTDAALKRAVAHAMRHSERQQQGPAYDKARAERNWAAAVRVVGEHARGF